MESHVLNICVMPHTTEVTYFQALFPVFRKQFRWLIEKQVTSKKCAILTASNSKTERNVITLTGKQQIMSHLTGTSNRQLASDTLIVRYVNHYDRSRSPDTVGRSRVSF